MSKLMQSRITLKGKEIDVAVNALEQSITRYIDAGSEYMAVPYQVILTEIQKVRKYGNGNEAGLLLVGGNIDCMASALKTAKLDAEATETAAWLEELVKKQTRGMSQKYL